MCIENNAEKSREDEKNPYGKFRDVFGSRGDWQRAAVELRTKDRTCM